MFCKLHLPFQFPFSLRPCTRCLLSLVFPQYSSRLANFLLIFDGAMLSNMWRFLVLFDLRQPATGMRVQVFLKT